MKADEERGARICDHLLPSDLRNSPPPARCCPDRRGRTCPRFLQERRERSAAEGSPITLDVTTMMNETHQAAKPPEEDLPNSQSLDKELADGVAKYSWYARSNYGRALGLTALAVLASIASTILVASSVSSNHPELVAVLAAIPTVVLIATSTFRFKQKAGWHWRKARALQTLHRKLVYNNCSIADISDRLSKVEMKLDQRWVTLGKIASESRTQS